MFVPLQVQNAYGRELTPTCICIRVAVELVLWRERGTFAGTYFPQSRRGVFFCDQQFQSSQCRLDLGDRRSRSRTWKVNFCERASSVSCTGRYEFRRFSEGWQVWRATGATQNFHFHCSRFIPSAQRVDFKVTVVPHAVVGGLGGSGEIKAI